MAINITPEERNFRFKTTQLGRYLLAFFVIGLAFTLIFFSPGKDPAPYIGLAGTLIGGIVMFYFSKSTSNEKMPVDATSYSGEDYVAPTMLPFTGNSPAANIGSSTPRLCSTGELHAANCGCGDCEPYNAPVIYEEVNNYVAPTSSYDFNAVLTRLEKEAKADGIKWTKTKAAMEFKVWLFNNITIGSDRWNEGIDIALDLASKAYTDVIGAAAPTAYSEVANYNTHMNKLKKDTKNKYGCGKVPAEAVRSAVMTLREVLKYHEDIS
jgi:hypothetical protein